MPSKAIEEFAQLLIRHVRDEAILSADMSLDPECNSVSAKRWRQSMKRGTVSFAKEIIPDVVDDTVFALLHAIDEGLLHLSFRSEFGRLVDLSEAGESEMGGWYLGGGWRAKYSRERTNDDFADLE